VPDTSLFLLWFLGVPAALAVGMLVLLAIEWTAWRVRDAKVRCTDAISGWRVSAAHKLDQRADHQKFLEWLAAQSGTDPSKSGVDERLVEAQAQAELIRALVEEEVPKAVLQCVDTHRLMAQVTGAYHLSEIAYEPECHQLRAGVVWILTHTSALLNGYPLKLDDKRLLHNAIVLRKRALPTCSRCPFIRLAVSDAPRLCPTAELVQIRGANAGNLA